MAEKRVAAEETVGRLSNELVFGSSMEERVRSLWALDKARHVLESKPFNRAPRPRSGGRHLVGSKVSGQDRRDAMWL
eukprot:5953568-Pyramimonas_sp.AAC.1